MVEWEKRYPAVILREKNSKDYNYGTMRMCADQYLFLVRKCTHLVRVVVVSCLLRVCC
jgi:hypothetical protein